MKHLKLFENKNDYYIKIIGRDFNHSIYGEELNDKSEKFAHENWISISKGEKRVITRSIQMDNLEVNSEELHINGVFSLEIYGRNPKNFEVEETSIAFTDASYVMCMSIYKLRDSYFYVDIYYKNTQAYYRCDQLDGLAKFLRECI